jgi:cell division protein FtsW
LAKRVSVDRWLFGATMVLVLIGLVMVFSASAVMARERFHSPYTFLLKQFLWAIAGIATLWVLKNVDYRQYKRPAIVFSLLGITTLLLIAVYFLDRSHNTHRWIRLGPMSIQPSEFAKPALILFLAYFLDMRAKLVNDLKKTILPVAFVTVLLAALIGKEPDLGTAIACVLIAMAIMFVAGLRFAYFGVPAALAPAVFYFAVWRVPWRHERILAFMNPNADPQGKGFHIIQSLIAVGTGGITGVGLMESKQKLFYLPEAHTDFIFAVTAEEWGLIGTLFIVILFATFLWRGMRVAVRTKDPFGRYLTTGITSMVVIQALFNISVVLALLPTKGIPLPFISYGGTSLGMTLACVGVLLNITQQTD